MIQPEVPKIVTGTVAEIEPLRITLVNDLAVNLSSVSLAIPGRLQPLKVGEQLYMLSTNNGKYYYVLDRV
jgi:hypothetical protein